MELAPAVIALGEAERLAVAGATAALTYKIQALPCAYSFETGNIQPS